MTDLPSIADVWEMSRRELIEWIGRMAAELRDIPVTRKAIRTLKDDTIRIPRSDLEEVFLETKKQLKAKRSKDAEEIRASGNSYGPEGRGGGVQTDARD